MENLGARMWDRMRSIWSVVPLAAVLAITACGGDGPTGPSVPATPEGAFTLQTIDAKSLPFTMYADGAYTLEVQSGTLSITANGKWVAKATTRETVAGIVSVYNDSTFGTWTQVQGSKTAALVNTESSTTSNATWGATDITVTEVDGTTTRRIVYRRN